MHGCVVGEGEDESGGCNDCVAGVGSRGCVGRSGTNCSEGSGKKLMLHEKHGGEGCDCGGDVDENAGGGSGDGGDGDDKCMTVARDNVAWPSGTRCKFVLSHPQSAWLNTSLKDAEV